MASAVVGAVTLCYAIVAAKSLHVHVGGMVIFAAWCATARAGVVAPAALVAVRRSSTS